MKVEQIWCEGRGASPELYTGWQAATDPDVYNALGMRSAAAKAQPPHEVLEGGNVRGWMLRAHLLWVREYGFAGEEAELAGPLLEGFDADGWYPFSSIIALDRSIAARFAAAGEEPALLEDLGRFSARVNLSMRFARWRDEDHHRFFEESTRVHHELQDFGSAHYQSLGTTRGAMTLSGYACFSPVYCSSAVGWFEQCLQLHGAIGASVTEQRCRCFGDDDCVFIMKWR